MLIFSARTRRAFVGEARKAQAASQRPLDTAPAAPAYYGNPSDDGEPRSPGARLRASSSGTVAGLPSGGGGAAVGAPTSVAGAGQVAPLGLSEGGLDDATGLAPAPPAAVAAAPEAVTVEMAPQRGPPLPAVGPLTAGPAAAAEQQRRRQQQQQQQQQQLAGREPQHQQWQGAG